MSKGLRHIKDPLELRNTIRRRLAEKKGGLGYLSACDAAKKLGLAPINSRKLG